MCVSVLGWAAVSRQEFQEPGPLSRAKIVRVLKRKLGGVVSVTLVLCSEVTLQKS